MQGRLRWSSCLLKIELVIFCLFLYLDEVSYTGCYRWLGNAESCSQVVSFVWVLTIWYSLGLVLWLSVVLESVLPLQRLKAWSLSKDQPRSIGISPKMKGPLLEFQKPVLKSTTQISDSAETQYCLPPWTGLLGLQQTTRGSVLGSGQQNSGFHF